MRRPINVPKTDTKKLVDEVLSRSADAILPRNLSDKWLRAIARDLAVVRKAQLEGRRPPKVKAIEMIVMQLLLQKSMAVMDEETARIAMTAGLEAFRDAVFVEIVGRETGVFTLQYTMENII